MVVDLEIDVEYVESVIGLATQNPTAQSIDQLLEAYTVLGFYEAQYLHRAEIAEGERKYAYAQAILEAKKSDSKLPVATLESIATQKTMPYVRAEAEAVANHRKMANLRDSVEQVINGIKFLGKNA